MVMHVILVTFVTAAEILVGFVFGDTSWHGHPLKFKMFLWQLDCPSRCFLLSLLLYVIMTISRSHDRTLETMSDVWVGKATDSKQLYFHFHSLVARRPNKQTNPPKITKTTKTKDCLPELRGKRLQSVR